MAETITKLPVKTEEKGTASALRPWRPFDSLRREIDQLFDEFDGGVWRWPFRRSLFDIEPFRRSEDCFPAIRIASDDAIRSAVCFYRRFIDDWRFAARRVG